MFSVTWLSVYSLLSLVVHALGVAYAAHAVMNVRTARGATAWSISLITWPWVAIPLYGLLGRRKFQGYSEAIKQAYIGRKGLAYYAHSNIAAYKVELSGDYTALGKFAAAFEPFPFTRNNETELLIDGEETFGRMLGAIASAERYILLQSYIIHSDGIGHQFKEALIEKARQGVTVHLLYDGLGSRKLSADYINELEANGVAVSSFRSTKGRKRRFQINFRNHRKILVVDGKIAFMGGLNIGDEYLGRDPHFGYWRDTHVQFRGTGVLCLQEILLRDLYWAGREVSEVVWEVEESPKYRQLSFILSTGPADRLQECAFFFLNIINHAKERLWIASPYFVPDSSTLNALKMAALRGVDVRIILPNSPDHLSVYLCAFSFYAELQKVGIQLYRYQQGFMHQKVILCDDVLAGVGTVNMDNRSFYLNFEVMSFVVNGRNPEVSSQRIEADGSRFIRSVEAMLEKDFAASRLVDFSEYEKKPLWFKLGARVTRLMAPIL